MRSLRTRPVLTIAMAAASSPSQRSSQWGSSSHCVPSTNWGVRSFCLAVTPARFAPASTGSSCDAWSPAPKLFRCTVCGASFETRRELMEHAKQHEGGAQPGREGRGAVKPRLVVPETPPAASRPGTPKSARFAAIGAAAQRQDASLRAPSSRFTGSVPAAPPPPPPPPASAGAKPCTSPVSAAPPKEYAVDAAEYGLDDFPCELCGKVFKSEMDLLQHLESVHPDGEMTETAVDVESNPLPTPEELLGMPAAAGNNDALSNAAMMQQMQRADAIDASAKISVRCALCSNKGRIYTSRSALFSHVLLKHPNEDAAQMVDEMIRAAEADSEAVVCPECGKHFSDDEALYQHLMGKHGYPPREEPVKEDPSPAEVPQVLPNKRWWCNECEKGFSSDQALYGHMVSKHGLASSNLPCPGCKRTFPDRFALSDHVRLSHKHLDANEVVEMVELVCSTCGRTFSDWDELKKHQQKHGHEGVEVLRGPDPRSSRAEPPSRHSQQAEPPQRGLVGSLHRGVVGGRR